jgi:hypothetical protein
LHVVEVMRASYPARCLLKLGTDELQKACDVGGQHNHSSISRQPAVVFVPNCLRAVVFSIQAMICSSSAFAPSWNPTGNEEPNAYGGEGRIYERYNQQYSPPLSWHRFKNDALNLIRGPWLRCARPFPLDQNSRKGQVLPPEAPARPGNRGPCDPIDDLLNDRASLDTP